MANSDFSVEAFSKNSFNRQLTLYGLTWCKLQSVYWRKAVWKTQIISFFKIRSNIFGFQLFKYIPSSRNTFAVRNLEILFTFLYPYPEADLILWRLLFLDLVHLLLLKSTFGRKRISVNLSPNSPTPQLQVQLHSNPTPQTPTPSPTLTLSLILNLTLKHNNVFGLTK